MAREKGTVKWFSTDKGYGFIRRETGDEIFVHHTDIDVEGYASLKNGETVEFDVFESDRGPKARNLVPLDAEGNRPAARARKAEPEGGKQGHSRRKRGGSRDSSAGQRSGRSEGRGSSGGGEPGEAGGGPMTLAQQLMQRLGKRFPGLRG